jgi:hypothetical protein
MPQGFTGEPFKLTLGKYLKKEIVCRNCNYKIRTYEEKETDVRVATKMMEDVFPANA